MPVPAVGSSEQATSAPVTIDAPSVGHTSVDECADGGDDGSGRNQDDDVGGMATPMHTD